MTDLSSHNSHTAPFPDSLVDLVPPSARLLDSSTSNTHPIEDEDYTIKCICAFQDDDGNTVFCERCETWQHIECYYHHDEVPEVHNCADCEPRPFDARSATERQRRHRERLDTGERRTKKSTTKSHKKKIKVSEYSTGQTNGWSHDRNDLPFLHDRNSGSPRDQPPPSKRPKTNHRASHSMNYQNSMSSHSTHHGKRSGSDSYALQSPPKLHNNNSTNGYSNVAYSLEFLQLYKDDPGDAPMQANLFNDIGITRSLSLWSHDVEALDEATNGFLPQDIFLRCDQPLDSMSLPQLRKEIKQDETPEFGGLRPTWTYLTIESFTPRNSIVGELRGTIGHMQDYVHNPSNRWDYLRHPVPFVFFHPRLPIYIDTRLEGTCCRYLRRSCRPNLIMRTILENGSDYHFCFVANEDLEPGAEITIGWVLDEHIRRYFEHHSNDEIKQEGVVDAEASYVTDWVGKVLADFGGCACNSPNECSLANYDRRNSSFSTDSAIYLHNGKSRKGRNGYDHASSQSTGRATNSRTGSEGSKQQDEEEQNDSRSSSGSLKPRSRETSPSHNATSNHGRHPEAEVSERELRKIAALEKSEQLEQDRHQSAHKKKKRNSGGSNLSTPAAATSKQMGLIAASKSLPNTPGLLAKPGYLEASASCRQPGSPAARSSHALSISTSTPIAGTTNKLSHPNDSPVASSPIRRNYVDSSIQTDFDEKDGWYNSVASQSPIRRPYISLTKRLLMRCHRDRLKLEEQTKASTNLTNGFTEEYRSSQQPDTSDVKENPNMDATRKLSVNIEDDVKMRDDEPNGDFAPRDLSSGPLVQKPRPPDHAQKPLDDTDMVDGIAAEIKPPPPPLVHHTTQHLPDQNQPANKYRSVDLRVQLPPTPLFSSIPMSSPPMATPTSIASPIPPSPFAHIANSYPPLFAASIPNAVQPSPIKKKISFRDYITHHRDHKKETPSTRPEKSSGSSPVLPNAMLKPSDSLMEAAKENTIEGIAVLETPKKENVDPLGDRECDVKDPRL